MMVLDAKRWRKWLLMIFLSVAMLSLIRPASVMAAGSDSGDGEIVLTKRIKEGDINFSNGSPTFFFRLQGVEADGSGHTYCRMVRLTPEDAVDADGYVSRTAVFSGLPAGIYTVSEEDSARYCLSSISGYGDNGTKKGNTLVIDLIGQTQGQAVFTGVRYEGGGFSDNDAVVNSLKAKAKERRIVSLAAEPKVGSVEPGQELFPDMLTVTAIYSDGSTEVLSGGLTYREPLTVTAHTLSLADVAEDGIAYSREVWMPGAASMDVEITNAASDTPACDDYRSGYAADLSSMEGAVSVSGTESLSGSVAGDRANLFVQHHGCAYGSTSYQLTATVTPYYDQEEMPSDYLLDMGAAPLSGDGAELMVSLNPETYENEEELALSASVTLPIRKPDAVMAADANFNSLLQAQCGKASAIVFTDEEVPEGVTAYDVSNGFDCPVYLWLDGTTAHISSGEGGKRITAYRNTTRMLYNMRYLTSIDLTNFHAADATDMSYMFYYCWRATEIVGLGNLDTSQAESLAYMFYNCWSLSSLDGAEKWSVSNVWDLDYAFYDCRSVTDIGVLEGWDTGSLLSSAYTFSDCKGISDISPLSGWDVSKDATLEGMFQFCSSATSLDALGSWDVSSAQSLKQTFSGCEGLTSLSGIAGWDVSSVTDMDSTFSSCSLITHVDELAGWDVGNVASMKGTFYYCSSLEDIGSLANWETGNVQSLKNMFQHCVKITDLEPLSVWDTGKATNMSGVFYECSGLGDLDAIAGWDTGAVETMNGMFYGCTALSDIRGVSGWDTSGVKDLCAVFAYCSQLQDLDAISAWDVGSATTLDGTFHSCAGLTDISGIRDWDVGAVEDMASLFYGCVGLTDMDDLELWDTRSLTSLVSTFQNCSSLTNVGGLANWDVGKVTSLFYTFAGCPVLTDVSGLAGWDTSSVTSFSYCFSGSGLTEVSALANWNVENGAYFASAFSGCGSLTVLNLGGWRPVSVTVTGLSGMFSSCPKLTTIYGQDWTALYSWESMSTSTVFQGCSSLIGDIPYASSKLTPYYCTPNGGYFTLPPDENEK